MKPTIRIMSVFMLIFLNASLVCGQDDEIPIAVESPFAKGNIFFLMYNNLGFNWKNLESNGESAGKRNRFVTDIEGTYFVADNIGIGVGLSSYKTKIKKEDIEQIEVSTMGSVNALYGHSIGKTMNLYGRGEFGIGLNKSKYESPGYSQENKYNEYGLNFEVGAPFALGAGTGFLFTPYVNYNYGLTKDDNYKDVSSGINLGTRLNFSLPCAAFAHDCSQLSAFSQNMYSKGTNVIGGSTLFSLNFGTVESSYIGDDMYNYENKLSDRYASVKVDYYHYIIDNLAIGAALRLMSSGEMDKETDYKQSEFSWMLRPEIQANLPVEGKLNNSFLFAGYGFGGSREKTTSANNETTERKYNNSKISFGAGYNMFMAKSLALVPVLNYSMHTSKDADSDAKDKRKGFEAELSLRHTF
jgi:Autotransporter beta-domain